VSRELVDGLRAVALAAAEELGWLDPGAPRSAAVAVSGISLGAYDDPRWVEFLSLVMSHPAFFALQRDARMLATLEALMGGAVRPSVGDICRVVSGDDERHTTVAHQDRFYVKGDGPLWTVWLPLGECPLSLGPLAVLPGSHEAGLLPHAGETEWRRAIAVPDDASWAASDLHVGDALFFSGLTVHRALPHRGGRRLRLSADYRFVPA
jgi:ectoine hydroxylase-related dioxygenase (phytanoyl-CoA dioxygenase family)